jgi:hypothetical protein
MSSPQPRTAQQIIDQAVRENRAAEWLCYILIAVFALTGVSVIIWGTMLGQGGVALAGGVASALVWPALRQLVAIRKTNMAIRLLEIPLAQAKTAGQAADSLRKAFLETFVPRSVK